jgi:hypothetical protein
MLTDIERALFEALRGRVEEVEARAQVHYEAHQRALLDRQRVISDYNATCLEALKREMETRGLVNCTKCRKMIPAQQSSLIFVQSAKVSEHGYGGQFISMDHSEKLHLACEACAQQMRDRHGWKGAYNDQLKESPFYHAFSVECREDGSYWMSVFGEKRELTEAEVGTLGVMPKGTIDLFAREWDIPTEAHLDILGKIVIPDLRSALV